MNMKILYLLLIGSFTLSGQTDTIKTYYENMSLKIKSYKSKNRIYENRYFENGQIKYSIVENKDGSVISMIGFNAKGDTTSLQSKHKSTIYDLEYNAVSYCKIKKGKFVGKSKCYQNGILIYEMPYKNGILEGIAIGYDEETKDIIAKEPYINGKLNGEGFYYNRGNILQRKIFYENGCPYKAQSFNIVGEVVFETSDKEIIEDKYHSTKYCK